MSNESLESTSKGSFSMLPANQKANELQSRQGILHTATALSFIVSLAVLTYTRVRARVLVVARRRACGGSESELFLHVVRAATCCLPMRPAEWTKSVSTPMFDVFHDAHHGGPWERVFLSIFGGLTYLRPEALMYFLLQPWHVYGRSLV